MYRFFIPNEKIDSKERSAILAGDEYRHAAKTLRLKLDDELEVFDGEGGLYQGRIQNVINKTFQIKLINRTKRPLDYDLQVFIATPKGKKIDFIVKGLTEVGATKISTFISKYTIARPTSEKGTRLKKIALEACKQSKRLHVPTVEIGISFSDLLNRVTQAKKTIVFYEKANDYLDLKKIKSERLTLVIGAEGGFSEEEVRSLSRAGAIISLLSDSILRAETAVITAAHLARYSQLLQI